LEKREQTLILILSILIIASGFTVISQRNQITQLNYKVNKQDTVQEKLETQIVVETLKTVLVEEPFSSLHDLIQDTNTVVLSTDLIGAVDLPRMVGGYRILLQSQGEIETLIETEGSFLYLRFTKFDSNIDHIMVGIRTAGVFDYAEGVGMYFKLSGTVTSGWIA